jgi:filamentous hemagglutinin family protein
LVPNDAIQNVLARVTGENPSDILGTLGTFRLVNGQTERSPANLFLINPNGIVFGESARLNLGGSFLGTTAHAVKLGELGLFSASEPTSNQLLAIEPSAFLFTQSNPGAIVNRSRASTTSTFSTFLSGGLFLVGGSITFDEGQAGSSDNRVELTAISGIGTVGLAERKLSISDSTPRGDITLQNQSALTTQQGDIAIYARNLNVIDRSSIITTLNAENGAQSRRAGDIWLNVSGKATLQQQGIVGSIVGENAVGSGANITVDAAVVEIDNVSGFSSIHSGRGDAGDIVINARDRISLANSQGSVSGRVSGISTFGLAGQGKAGNIRLKTGSLRVQDGSAINSISDRIGDSGNIVIDVQGGVILEGFIPGSFLTSRISTNIRSTGTGKGGDVQLTAETLDVKRGGSITTSIAGKGNAGNIKIDVRDRIVIDEAASRGDSRFISSIFSSALPGEGEGNSGNIDISTGTLTVTNGATISSDIGRNGNAGNITINARDQVTFDGFSPIDTDLIDRSSRATTLTTPDVIGNSGNITISTGVLTLSNGGSLISDIYGQGSGGNVVINARDRVLIRGRSSGFSQSSITTTLSGAGRAGDITINTESLRLEEGGAVVADGTGRGEAGKIFVNAIDSTVIDGSVKISGDFQSVIDRLKLSQSIIGDLKEILNSSQISSNANLGSVNGGDIQISTGRLILTNGGSISGYSLSGNSANITINARDQVILDGISSNFILANGVETRYRSGINNAVSNGATGKVGTVRIETGELSILNGAEIASNTAGGGSGGNITINARNQTTIDGKQFGRASNISSGSSDTLLLDGTVSRGRGDAGTISINTGILAVRSNGFITSSSESEGEAGNIDIKASQVRLDQSAIATVATAVDGGNININASKLLLLRNGSLISTQTGVENAQGVGTGGNINVNARFLVAIPKEDSDINADATRGRGGNVNINAQAIFGIQPRFQGTSLSDITASSEIGLSGNITLNSPDSSIVQNALFQLPSNIDTNTLLANSCITRNPQNGTFYITGTGGLPSNPGDLSAYPTGTVQSTTWKRGDPIVEPQSVYQLPNGQLLLSRECGTP